MKNLSIAYALKKRAKKMAEGGETSTTGNKTKTGGSNPGGASTGGAGTVTITTGKNPPSIDVHDVGGRTAARNAGGMDPGDEDDLGYAEGGYADSNEAKQSKPPVDPDVYKKRMQSIIKMGKGNPSYSDDPQMMAEGGEASDGKQRHNNERGVHKNHWEYSEGISRAGAAVRRGNMSAAKMLHHDVSEYIKSMKKPNLYAEGGQITDNYQNPHNPHEDADFPDKDHHIEEKASGFVDHEGNVKRSNGMAVAEDDRRLNEHGEYEQGPYSGGEGFHEESYMGNPGNAHDMYSDTEDGDGNDMVGRIMKQRANHYSEGGKVANESGIGRLSQMADDERNSFDDLVLRDDLKENYTGANSGDELGDAQEDHDRRDIVARIMASRKKKDRMPHPA